VKGGRKKVVVAAYMALSRQPAWRDNVVALESVVR
jgi:hypothetical protein